MISETPGKLIEAPGWLLTELNLIRQTPPIPSLTKHVCVFVGFVPAGLVESKPSIEPMCFRISISEPVRLWHEIGAATFVISARAGK